MTPTRGRPGHAGAPRLLVSRTWQAASSPAVYVVAQAHHDAARENTAGAGRTAFHACACGKGEEGLCKGRSVKSGGMKLDEHSIAQDGNQNKMILP